MIRLFEQHRIRKQKELEGMWHFIKEDGTQYEMPVPGCWEQHPDMTNYRGEGLLLQNHIFAGKMQRPTGVQGSQPYCRCVSG